LCTGQRAASGRFAAFGSHIKSIVYIQFKSIVDQTDDAILSIWEYLAADIERKAIEFGGAEVLDWLGTTASHVFQVPERVRIEAVDLSEALEYLDAEHVER